MYPTLIEYLGFIVAALILGWAIIEISRRYLRQRRVESLPMNTWVTFDSTLEDDVEKSSPGEESDEEEESVSPFSQRGMGWKARPVSGL